MNEKNKCGKYESFFIFADEKNFYQHLENCPECKKIYEKHLKVSKLVKESASMYLERLKKEKISVIKKAACFFICIIALSGFIGCKMYDNYIFELNSADYDSYISALGLPTDDYGFLDL